MRRIFCFAGTCDNTGMAHNANKEIARLFRLIAMYLRSQDIAFKPQAYERAAQSLDLFDQDVSDMGLRDLEQIPGVGKALALKIQEFAKTRTIKEFEKLKKRFPFDMESLAAVEGIGPKTAYKLYKKLGIKTIQDLRKALTQHAVQSLPGFGEKSERKLFAHLQFSQQANGRFLLGSVYDQAQNIQRLLAGVPGVERLIVAGSIRRMKETVRDMDFLAVSRNPKRLMDACIAMPGVVEVYGAGNTKSSVRLESGIDVDVRVVPEKSWGAALNYFTGSKEHNIALRELAIEKGWKLNEYGLYRRTANGEWRMIAGKTEQELYEKLGLDYIEPEMRENIGELELARTGKLPRLISVSDIKGDLQMHTDWSDGEATIEQMARAAARKGYEYIAITDHTKSLGIARGMDEKTIRRQFAAIDALNKKLQGTIRILKGLEVNILKNGTLDISDAVLAKADFVGASVHSAFAMSERDMTGRIMRAMENRHVHVVFHPTGRLLFERQAYEVDIEELARCAARTHTMLEINAFPNRLDLNDSNIRLAKKHHALFSLGTDSHNARHLDAMLFGAGQARRGWCEKRDVANTHSCSALLALLKQP